MKKKASVGPYGVDWRPAGAEGDDLVMHATAADPAAARRVAAAAGATVFRITAADGFAAVADAGAIAAWDDGSPLPASNASWAPARRPADDAARAGRLLGAFLSWSRARGVLDEEACRRISSTVQMEMAGEVRDTPR